MSMIDYHMIDAQSIYTHTVQIDPMRALPGLGCTEPLPQLQGEQVARWTGGDWDVLEHRPQPPVPMADPVPESCQRRQGRLALLMQGQLDQVEAHIESITDPFEKRAAQIEYEADTWERDNTLLQQMWAILGGTPESLDDMFRLAVTL